MANQNEQQKVLTALRKAMATCNGVECLLLNEDKTPHMTLFDGGPFPNDKAVDDTIQKLLDYKI